ncbi:MAG: hypothetical protein DU429_02485 [Candidatus Tokpelaia sp.]|nr:MAG: hypothetical protein DU430_05235 [Candidatus Tokpelaia sp.]KAA6207350.1 MAG: hypothetical protein DU429_02485 [Candidatus Tokpelaia sp.]KAA6405137.1 hypothetical protein DPQ22_06190 [Candidatus Tokpelaia sp.]
MSICNSLSLFLWKNQYCIANLYISFIIVPSFQFLPKSFFRFAGVYCNFARARPLLPAFNF